MTEAFLCAYVRTPIGRYGGALSAIRADDLAAAPIRELLRRHPNLAGAVDEVILGNANQAGEDNRNLARMASCWRACRTRSPASRSIACAARAWTRSRTAARAIKAGEIELAIAGGVESDDARAVRHGESANALLPATPKSTTPRSAGASSTRR